MDRQDNENDWYKKEMKKLHIESKEIWTMLEQETPVLDEVEPLKIKEAPRRKKPTARTVSRTTLLLLAFGILMYIIVIFITKPNGTL